MSSVEQGGKSGSDAPPAPSAPESAHSTPPPPPLAAEPKRGRRSQAERTAQSDRRMLRAALKLISERGYRGTSLAAIGEEAGYSRGLVNERFGSKDGLLWVLVKDMLRVWKRDIPVSDDPLQSGLDQLCTLLDSHRDALKRYEPIRAFYALMFEAMGPIPQLLPEFQGLHRSFRADIEATLRRAIAAELIRPDIDPAAQAVILLGALRGIAFQWLLDREAFALDAAYDELKRSLRRSLAPCVP
jgi:AcrR family transcriptional regulator